MLLLEKKVKGVCADIHPSRDEKADAYQLGFITWMSPLFWQGFKQPLAMHMLPNIEAKLMTAIGLTGTPSISAYATHVLTLTGADGRHQLPLLIELFIARRWYLINGIVPRLCYTAFTYTQPFLISTATSYMAEPINDNTYKVGGGLIAAFFLVYAGLGVRSIATVLMLGTSANTFATRSHNFFTDNRLHA